MEAATNLEAGSRGGTLPARQLRAVMKALAADTTTILGPSLPLVNDTTLSSTIDGWDCSEFSLSCHRSGNTKEEGRVFGNKATGDHVGVENAAQVRSTLRCGTARC